MIYFCFVEFYLQKKLKYFSCFICRLFRHSSNGRINFCFDSSVCSPLLGSVEMTNGSETHRRHTMKAQRNFRGLFYSLSIFLFQFHNVSVLYSRCFILWAGDIVWMMQWLFVWCFMLWSSCCWCIVIVVFVVVVDDDVVLVGDVSRQNVICCCCRLSCCWFFSCRIHRKKCFVDKVTKRKWQQRTKRNDRKI